MLELDGSQVNIIKRTSITGVTTSVVVPQSDWNQDPLDGTGVSGIDLDFTKAQLMFTEYEWLGVGCVRVGFVNENGVFHIAHIFNHANTLDTTYITTASLPVRYEIFNTGVTTSPSTMKQVCVSIQSNGGYEHKKAFDVVRNTTAVTVSTTSFVPLLSIRLTPGREDAIIIPSEYNVLPDSNTASTFEVALIKNATLTGASFISTSTSSPNAQVDFSATALIGGTIVKNDYLTSANKATAPLNVFTEYNWDLQLGRTQAKVSDIYTLAIRAVSGSGTALGSLSFYDLT